MILALILGCAGPRGVAEAEPLVGAAPVPFAAPLAEAEPLADAERHTDAVRPSGGVPPEAQSVYRALSVRDPEPDCATVEALSPTPLATLLLVIQHAEQPPWVGIRAATCVLDRHAQLASPALLDWVEGPRTRGLALLVLDRLDRLPEPLALDLAAAALKGPHAADAAERVARSSKAELRALLPSSPPEPR